MRVADYLIDLKRHHPLSTIIVSLLVIGPIGLVILFYSLLAMVMGVGALLTGGNPAVGILFVVPGGLSCWFIYSLVVSLWLKRRETSIVLGLIFGWIVLSLIVIGITDSILTHSSENEIWPAMEAINTWFFGIISLNGWVLTTYLLFRAAYPKRSSAPYNGAPPTFRKLGPRAPKLSANLRLQQKPSHHRMATLPHPSIDAEQEDHD